MDAEGRDCGRHQAGARNTSGLNMTCPELDSLQARHKAAVDEFVEIIKELQGIKRIPSTGFAELAKKAEAAKRKAEDARRALRSHIIDHGCC